MKRNFAWLFVALFFTSCAANKDIIRSIPEDGNNAYVGCSGDNT